MLGVLSMAAGLTFSSASASGESTSGTITSPLSGTSSTFTWSYEFNATGGHDLSNIAISFCSTSLLSHVVSASPSGETFLSGDVPGGHTGFGPGIKFGTTAVTGTLTIVFDQPYPATGTMSIQSHSGDGQVGDLITTATGPGPCDPEVTTTTAPATTTTVPATTTTVPATTTTVPATTTTVPATTTTVPATTTTTVRTTTTTAAVLGTSSTIATTTTVPATTSTTVPTSVLGEVFVNEDPALAKTGFSGIPMIAFGLLCLMLGGSLVVSGWVDRADA